MVNGDPANVRKQGLTLQNFFCHYWHLFKVWPDFVTRLTIQKSVHQTNLDCVNGATLIMQIHWATQTAQQTIAILIFNALIDGK